MSVHYFSFHARRSYNPDHVISYDGMRAGDIAHKLPSRPVGGPGGGPGGGGDDESDDDDNGDGAECPGGPDDEAAGGAFGNLNALDLEFDDENVDGYTPGGSTTGVEDYGDRAATLERIERSLGGVSSRHTSISQNACVNEHETEEQREDARFRNDMERARQLSLGVVPPDDIKQEDRDDNEHSMFVSPGPSSRATGLITSARPTRVTEAPNHLARPPSFADFNTHSFQRRRALSHASFIDPPPSTSAATTARPGSSSPKRRRLESTTRSSSPASRHTTPARPPTPSPLLRQATDTARRGSSILAPTLDPRRRTTSAIGDRTVVGPRGSVSRSTRHGSFQGPGRTLREG
jgi:hypothetical protein